MMRARDGLVAALVLLCAAVAGDAQAKRSWSEEKCSRYERDWNEALRRYGLSGSSPEFLAGGAAFIRSGCGSLDKVCPHREGPRACRRLAIRVVNEGMSTTFLPFDCLPSPDCGRRRGQTHATQSEEPDVTETDQPQGEFTVRLVAMPADTNANGDISAAGCSAKWIRQAASPQSSARRGAW